MPKKEKKESMEKERMRFSGKRSMWRGFLSFGLVSIPVSLFTTFAEKEISFNLLCKTCFTPIRYKRWCDTCNKEVPWNEVVKGYRVASGEYVVFTQQDFESIPLPTERTIEIEEFVDGSQIDPVFFEKSYYVIPEKGGERAYHLLLSAMESLGRSAIAKVVLRNREDLTVLRPYKGAFILTLLHYSAEIVDIGKIAGKEGEYVLPKEEVKLAEELVTTMTHSLDLAKYKDNYRAAIEQMVKEKVAGKYVARPPPKAAEVKNLVVALKKSIEKAK